MQNYLRATKIYIESSTSKTRERGEEESIHKWRSNTNKIDLFPEVRLWRTYVPIEESTKDGSLSTLSFSQTVTKIDGVFFPISKDNKSPQGSAHT
jgi:hypothetical protein